MEIGIKRGIYYSLKKNNWKSDFFAIIPSANVLNLIPDLHIAQEKNRYVLKTQKERESLLEFKNFFEHSHKIVFSRILSDIHQHVPYWTIRQWLVHNVIPRVKGETKVFKCDINVDLETLSEEKLWRYDKTYITTECFLPKIKNFTLEEAVSIGINANTFNHWKNPHRKNKDGKRLKKFESEKLLIIPNSEFIEKIPSVTILQNNRIIYIKKRNWKKLENFRSLSKHLSKHYIFCRIIAKRSNLLDKKDPVRPDIIQGWLRYGNSPRVTPDYDYEKIFQDLNRKKTTKKTQLVSALLGRLFSHGGGFLRFKDPVYKKYTAYFWRGNVEKATILFEELLPTTEGTGYDIYERSSRKDTKKNEIEFDEDDGEEFKEEESVQRKMKIDSVDPFFIRFLEKHKLLTWNDTIGYFNCDISTVMNKFSEENCINFLANAIVPNLTIAKDKGGQPRYFYLTIPTMKKPWKYVLNYIAMLITGDVHPSVLYIHSSKSSKKVKEIEHLCKEPRIRTQWIPSDSELGIRVTFGSRGGKYSGFDFDKNADTFRRLVDEIIPNAFIESSKLNDITTLSHFYNKDYAMKMKNRYPSKNFRESLESVGYINTDTLDKFLRRKIDFTLSYQNLEKEQKEYIVSYHIPYWRK